MGDLKLRPDHTQFRHFASFAERQNLGAATVRKVWIFGLDALLPRFQWGKLRGWSKRNMSKVKVKKRNEKEKQKRSLKKVKSKE